MNRDGKKHLNFHTEKQQLPERFGDSLETAI